MSPAGTLPIPAGATPVQLVIIDQHLPDGDGDDLAARIVAHPQLKRTPVVVVSTSAPPAGSDLPCPWHEKPMSIAELVRLVRSFKAAYLDARPRDRPRPAGA